MANHKVMLTEKGHQQACEAGRVLRSFLSHKNFAKSNENCPLHRNHKSILFYTLPYARARETCTDIINQIKDLPDVTYSVNEEPRMREQDFGNFQSTAEEMEKVWEERAHYGHFFYRIPHGELAADVYDRAASFNESLFRQFRQNDFPHILVLVTHGIWARVFLMKWFRWNYEEFEALRNIPHCQYIIMKQDEKTGKFDLKTPLQTWDDLPEEQMDYEVTKEIGDEVSFNSKNKLANPNDLDIDSIIKAQTEAIRAARHKDQHILDQYKKLKNGQGAQRFKLENQSAGNSLDTLPREN